MVAKFLVLGIKSVLIDQFCERAARTRLLYRVDMDNKLLMVNGSKIALPKNEEALVAMLRQQKNGFAGCWIFDPGVGQPEHQVIRKRMLQLVNASGITRIWYVGSPAFDPRTVSDNPLLQWQWIHQPLVLYTGHDGEELLSAGLLEELLAVKAEVEKKMPTYWQHHAFPLPERFCGTYFQTAYLPDFIEFLNGQLQKQPTGKSTISWFMTSNLHTLSSVLQEVLGLTILPVPDPSGNALALLIEKVTGAYLYAPLPGYEEEVVTSHSSVWLNNLSAFRPLTGPASNTPDPGVLTGMQQKQVADRNGSTIRYWTGGEGTETALIINALGLTINFWEGVIRLLMQHMRVIVWETRCCDVLAGGMKEVVTIDDHTGDIENIISAENNQSCHLISWCNGGRIAVAAAVKLPTLISSVLFLCPVFRGVQAIEADDTKFEKDLDEVFAGVLKNHKVADLFATYLVKSNTQAPDPVANAAQVLSLPDHSFREAVVAPMRTGEFLLNYALRTKNDEQFPVHSLAADVRQPVLFVLGSEDAVISNRLTLSVASLFANARTAMVQGASHYIQLQQPEIFTALALSFIHRHQEDFIHSRVERLN